MMRRSTLEYSAFFFQRKVMDDVIPSLALGANVTICSLRGRVDLNGLRGTITKELDATATPPRYRVRLRKNGQVLALRPNNVVLVRKSTARTNLAAACMRLMLYVMGACAVLAAVLFILAHLTLPRLSGTVTVSSSALEHDVTIVRDGLGVPHIFATTPRDAHFGAGFAHAQDRMWQMEMNRRIASGRVAEIVGSSALPLDRLARTLGFRRRAAASLPHHSDELRAALEGYADGVNEWLAQARWWHFPLETHLLWAPRPAPWSVLDSLAYLDLLSFAASQSWGAELLLASLVKDLGAERAAEIHPSAAAVAANEVAGAAANAPNATATATAAGPRARSRRPWHETWSRGVQGKLASSTMAALVAANRNTRNAVSRTTQPPRRLRRRPPLRDPTCFSRANATKRAVVAAAAAAATGRT